MALQKVQMPIKKVKKNLFKLTGKVHFCYSCKLTTAQNMKNIKSFGSQLSTAVLNLSKYQHNIMLSKITSDYRHQQNSIKYLDIFVINRTPILPTPRRHCIALYYLE